MGRRLFAVSLFLLLSLNFLASNAISEESKKKILVISSYHREFIWSQQTNQGFCQAMIDMGYMDDKNQAEVYSILDEVESKKAVIKKLWMDTKRKNSPAEIEETVDNIKVEAEWFDPDLIFLGDDNAANYIGHYYKGRNIPVVFWGVNGSPLKYGFMNSLDNPGSNITGVYQESYLLETIAFMKKLVPQIKTIAVLSDDSPTGKPYTEKLKKYQSQGKLQVELVETVVTNSVEDWKKRALELSKSVDSFFIGAHYTLKNSDGTHADPIELAAWFLKTIKKPSCAPTHQMVKEGFLCTVDDSAYNQAYEAVKMAHNILSKKSIPSTMRSYYPKRGPFVVNKERAEMLNIDLAENSKSTLVEQFIDTSLALREHP